MRRRTVLGGLAASGAAGAGPSAAGRTAEPSIDDLALDLAQVPLSRAGSYLTLGADGAAQAPLRLATVRKTAMSPRGQSGAWSHDLATFGLLAEEAPLSAVAQADPRSATLRMAGETAGPQARITFADAETLQVEAQAAAVRVLVSRAFSWREGGADGAPLRGLDFASGHVVRAEGAFAYRRLNPAGGPEQEEIVVPPGGVATLRFTALVEEPGALQTIDAGSLEAWMARAPRFAADATPELRRATRMAWFLFWNLQVAPSGAYRRTAILSSKRSLSQVWSWDNLFNALAVVRADPELAWAQLFLILDHQAPDGVLPDTVSDLRATYGFNKPPLWGWTVRRLLPHTPAPRRAALLAAAYPKLARLHDWWLSNRDLRGDGAPCYLSGNDSGWDNATVFAKDGPVQSPDLTALLTLDAEALGEMAAALGRPAEAARWRTRSADLLARFHRIFVEGDELRFFVRTLGGWEPRRSTSLLTRIPILLGRRLAEPLRRRIVRELADPAMFAAPCGPASESLSSSLYAPAGYWRGPVWGPSTLLIAEGLRAAGEPALARTLGDRYRATCAREATFRENYDARTGAGNDDSGMTWSAADHLLLGQEVAE